MEAKVCKLKLIVRKATQSMLTMELKHISENFGIFQKLSKKKRSHDLELKKLYWSSPNKKQII